MILEWLPNGDLVYWCPACCRQHAVSTSSWEWPGSFGDFAVAPGVAVSLSNETRLCRHFLSREWSRRLGDLDHSVKDQAAKAGSADSLVKPGRLGPRGPLCSLNSRYRGYMK
jgi:hypothetical protein